MQSEDLINQVLEEIESFNIDDIPNIDLTHPKDMMMTSF